MSNQPFIGDIQAFPFGYAPQGWLPCNGQMLQVNQNQALYAVLGVTYGGNGQTTFALPDLRGRIPVHDGANGIVQGSLGGEATHQLSVAEMPAHLHALRADATANATTNNAVPVPGNALGQSVSVPTRGAATPLNIYNTAPTTVATAAGLANAGGNQAHENRQPFLALNFCIAVQGNYPTRN